MKLTPKKLTIKQTKRLLILSFVMATASIVINHTLPDHKWLYWLCLSVVYSIPAYIWFQPAIKKYYTWLFKGKSKFDAFENDIGKSPKSYYNHDKP